MSLINDALRKAQKQRTGESPPLASLPGIGGESAAKIAKRAKPAGFNSQLIRLGLIGGGTLVLLVVGYFAVRAFTSTTGIPPAPPPQLAAPKPGEGGSSGLNPSAPAPSPAVTFNLPIAPSPVTTPAADPAPATVATKVPMSSSPAVPPPDEPRRSSPNTVSAAPVAGLSPQLAAPKPGESGTSVPASPLAAPKPGEGGPAASKPVESVPAKPASPPPKLEPRAIAFIENLRIAGIRASATDSKVLMNDRVYRVGDTVEHEMGLKLIAITSSSLTFEDEHGGRYTRSF